MKKLFLATVFVFFSMMICGQNNHVKTGSVKGEKVVRDIYFQIDSTQNQILHLHSMTKVLSDTLLSPFNTQRSAYRTMKVYDSVGNQNIEIGDAANVVDSLALVALFNQCNGINWIRKANWLSGPLATWEGVYLENDRVVALDRGGWPSTGLAGAIPTELSNLTQIEYLFLENNQLNGSLPDSWSALVSLKQLDLGYNQITGVLPVSWASLVNLQRLILGVNQISGTLPGDWSALVNLQWLAIYNTPVSGNLPASWASFVNLERLYLYNTLITGSLPASWSSLTKLKYLSLFNNQLSGSLPASWSAFDSLLVFALNDNQLTGSLPESWSALTNIRRLDLNDNQLTGSLPETWSSFVNLELLYIYNNQLSGSLPASWSALSNVLDLWLHNNQFSGNLPLSWQTLFNLQQLYLNNNQLTGILPASWSTLVNLRRLGLGQNQFTGTLPENWSALVNLDQLILGFNQLSGTLPTSWSTLINMRELFINFNQLTGTLPTSWSTMVKLQQIILNDNQLTGGLPESWSYMVELQTIFLYNNQLTGTLPTSWSSMTKMYNISLNNNELTGSLPGSWSAFTQLRYFLLNHNHFSGPLPESWSSFVNLLLFYLTSNQLSGSIPSGWTTLPNLNSILLDSNNISGLPNLTSMANLGFLTVNDNFLDFGDIEPNIGIGYFIYSPQALIGEPDTLIRTTGEEFSASVTVGGNSNQYQWYKNLIMIQGATDSEYVIPSVIPPDSGIYTCKITNSVATSLTLNSQSITLKVVFVPTVARVTTTPVTNITQITATSGGNVTYDGGSTITARGVCWSTSPNPTILDSHTTDGNGTGVFISNLIGLIPNSNLYYIRAYAVNSMGISYGNELVFSTPMPCPGITSITINHLVSGGVAPVNKISTYNLITNVSGEPSKCWITSNLGSDNQAAAVNDATETSAGWYWQFNRKQGYKHNGTVRTPNTIWISSMNENSDWNAINDPCAHELGNGFRIPTKTEWENVNSVGGWINWNGPWNSGLNLHSAGNLSNTDGSLLYRGFGGYFWSSSQYNATDSWNLFFYSGISGVFNYSDGKAYGFSLRCLRETPITPTTTTVIGTVTQTTCYNATQTINVSGNGTTFTIQSGGSATMIAGQNIVYLPTTSVQPGGYMRGYIAPSGPWCVAPSMPAVAMVEDEIPMSVQQSSFKVYPNPTSGTFILELTGDADQVKVDIFGIWGEKVLTSVIIGERKHEFSLSDKPAGIFFIRVLSGDKAETVKIIKQ